jgi:membrane protein implicated in regulation of membrane protease activity
VGFHLSHLSALLLVIAVGALAFGLVADSWAAAAVGFLLIGALAVSFPTLRRMAVQLEDRPTKTGMSALVGQRGTVVRWKGQSGTVRLQGSLWNAVGPAPAPGAEVEVVGWSGSTIRVSPTQVTNREQA